MPENTFDIVSKIDLQEVSNAIQQAMKEVTTRFDLKDSKSSIALEGKDAIILHSIDEYKLKAINDILQAKLVKHGIPIEKAKAVVQLIKNSKKKAQASIQGDLVRISGKDRDTLQEIIALLKQQDFGIDMQFTNYRTN